MTDVETLARLRASEMSPGEFLEALESTQEMLLPEAPDSPEMARMREERDTYAEEIAVWRFSCIVSWSLLAITVLAVMGRP